MRITLNYSASKGMNVDAPQEQLPLTDLSWARNMRFEDTQLKRVGFEQRIMTGLGFTSTFGMPVQVGDATYWALAGTSQVRGLLGTTHADITKQSTTYSVSGAWQGCMFNGVPILTNGVEVPQIWNPVSLGQKLTDLPNWTVGEASPVLRPFYTVLVSIGLVQGGTLKPYRIKTSQIADPGSLPGSWDATDPTKDIVTTDISDTEDKLVDGLVLGSNFLIYKTDSTWALQSGSAGSVRSPFRVTNVFRDIGLFSPNCVVNIINKHFMLTRDDIVLHNGSSIDNPGERKFRRWLFKNINSNYYERTFVKARPNGTEVWIVFVPSDADVPMMCAIWNIREDKWTVMDMQGQRWLSFVTERALAVDDTWDTAVGTWETDLQAWNVNAKAQQLSYAVGMVGDSITLIDHGMPPSGGLPVPTYIMREDFPFGNIGKDGQVYATFERIKNYRYMFPRVRAAAGTKLQFAFGARDVLQKPAEWTPYRPFTVGRDSKVDVFTRARYLSYKVYCEQQVPWAIDGLDMELELLGKV